MESPVRRSKESKKGRFNPDVNVSRNEKSSKLQYKIIVSEINANLIFNLILLVLIFISIYECRYCNNSGLVIFVYITEYGAR